MFIIIFIIYTLYMGVSKNSGTPKWMVKIMENPIKMNDLGVPLFLETPIYVFKFTYDMDSNRSHNPTDPGKVLVNLAFMTSCQ